MIMKKMILTMVAALVVSSSFAFHQGPRQMTPADRTDKMAKELNLSKKQKAKVLALNEKYADAFAHPGKGGPRPPKDGKFEGKDKDFKKGDMQKDCKKGGCCKDDKGKRPELTAEQKAKMEAMHKKREAYDSELKTILSNKQYQTYKENMHKHHGGRGHHGHGDHGEH